MTRVIGWLSLVGVVTVTSAATAEPVAAESQARIQVELEPQQAALVQKLPVADGSPNATALQKQGYDWKCSGRCELVLPPGRHTFGLTTDGGSVVAPSELELPAGRSKLHARYYERANAVGWVVVGTSPVTWYASLMIMKGLNGGVPVSGGQFALGTGIGIAQLVVGIVLVSRPGAGADFTLTPVASMPARSRFGVERQFVARDDVQGLGLQLRF
jgi:hypothetical protein